MVCNFLISDISDIIAFCWIFCAASITPLLIINLIVLQILVVFCTVVLLFPIKLTKSLGKLNEKLCYLSRKHTLVQKKFSSKHTQCMSCKNALFYSTWENENEYKKTNTMCSCLLAGLRKSHAGKRGWQGFGIHFTSGSLEVVILPGLRIWRLQKNILFGRPKSANSGGQLVSSIHMAFSQ